MRKIKTLLIILVVFMLVGCNSDTESTNKNSKNFEDLKQAFIDAGFEIKEGNLFTDMVNSIYVVYGDSEENNLVAEYTNEDIAKTECDSNNEAGYSVCARNGKFIVLYDEEDEELIFEAFNKGSK
ncbi:MAG: hypothetical protein PHG03_02745 [Bacilli bacterium]|nr:hypothetical protein [Bacilli bacterium]MDD4795459.1 hypothetical protein [Bacilli bacterium]